MSLELSNTPSGDFVEYNRLFKKWSVISIFSFIAIIIALYFIFVEKLQIFEGTWIPILLHHIKTQVFSYSALGLFYVCLFGGLFFLFIPVEAFYIAALKTGKLSPLHIILMIIGILASYSLNYIIGLRFSGISKKFVSPKKFYKTKIIVNKFGKFAILFLNIIALGSQQLTFVLGVFHYNKTRILVFTVIGQLIKFAFITATVLGLF